jgi:hypothetical protein
MSDSGQSKFNVSAADLCRYDWQTRLAQHDRKECCSFCEVLAAGAMECQAANDDLGRRVFSLLHTVASFWPNFDAKGNPYGSMMSRFDGTRSLNAEDLTEPDLAALTAILEKIEDPEYRARVADVLWVTKRNFKAACIAVNAFLESAERLKTHDRWPLYTERLERAARIASVRGFETERKAVVAAVEAAITGFEHNAQAGLLCHRLMTILLMLREGDITRYAPLAERMARDFATEGSWQFSEAYWQCAEQWHRRARNAAEAQRCQLESAECNVSLGEAGLAAQGAMCAAHWVGRGLEALRRAKADPVRIKSVNLRFLELQRASLSELKTITADEEAIPGFRENEKLMQEKSAAFVRGKDFQAALERFANITLPTNLEELRKQYAKASEHTIFDKIIGSSAIDHTGKVADTIPPSGFGTPEEEAETLRKKLCQQARTINWPMQVAWKIEPARIVLLHEHPIRLQDLLVLVQNNPFIPQGHEGIYLRGLQSGFFGDWLTALHLLIPQVEASIRLVLQQHGSITSTLDSDGTQQERDINQLLWLPEVEKIFGQDIVFDLRGILIERFGHNLRNECAHGLLPEGGFYQAASVYLWWLILRLCWIGFRVAQQPASEPPKESSNP